MAKKSRSKKRGSKKNKGRTSKRSKVKAKSKHIPLNILEKRAKRLNSIVLKRGGTV